MELSRKSPWLPASGVAVSCPALVFGLLAVAAMAWLLKEFGLPDAGVFSAFLLAIHPWNIRYASEARGYSLVVFLVPVLFVFWRRAMLTGRWKWWGALAATQFSLIYCYPGAMFVLIVLNLITLALIATGRDCAEPRITQSGRWFCVNVLAAILTFQLMLPLYRRQSSISISSLRKASYRAGHGFAIRSAS